ncbi:hypothetical protein GCM10011491_00440 [Brucella endophytica]|uniref:Antitoxin n=1 Tax=Brucella endophytica TaxID=1963359 RepID=A0A916RZ15_9HYPH|nr:hypothetical protein GCM10011491_00440 [Brucella endophytica]
MRQFTTGDLNKQVGDVTDAASREPVILTKHRKPRFVLMSYEHYERLRTGGNPRSAHLASENAGRAQGDLRSGNRPAGTGKMIY